jgi:hypothetical protein
VEPASLADVPPVVREALRRVAGPSAIREVEKATKAGVTTYEAEYRVDGVEHSVKVSPRKRELKVRPSGEIEGRRGSSSSVHRDRNRFSGEGDDHEGILQSVAEPQLTEAQWHLTRRVFIRFSQEIGLTSRATDWEPQLGILFTLPTRR